MANSLAPKHTRQWISKHTQTPNAYVSAIVLGPIYTGKRLFTEQLAFGQYGIFGVST